jgi:hypothetical protein
MNGSRSTAAFLRTADRAEALRAAVSVRLLAAGLRLGRFGLAGLGFMCAPMAHYRAGFAVTSSIGIALKSKG